MTRKDEYYNRAKQEGYRTRAAYKLKQLDREANLLDTGDTVVDLGAAPGGWLQVAAEKVGPSGTVVGVDFQRIRELDHDNVETIKGDMTEERTKDRLMDTIGEGGADLVISDLAPNMTGEYDLDHARSVHLARQAFEVAKDVLATDGDFAVKVFQGQDLEVLREEIEDAFQYVRTMSPEASRDSSSEVYLVGKHRLTAPVSVGDTREVEITDVGEEGDGVAEIEGFTLFVSGTTTGETVEVRITDVKPTFAFAERVD
ncbi:TRAM domain-containing protein [Halonotius terrestris]|uniref:Ribosomal RNA large subunit methyltransferase E n=1 Tax=Halonotius terrestris TaxID=2487750 RepID=A0A8J8PDN4_9EURY|nr:23S rRNA (uridine(2552)-2'-O)-methyltransferase [Halonotius terrestris]TQQ83466.1 TRAM domain-containing protein [Halonotius terrestris]